MPYVQLWRNLSCAEVSSCLKLRYPSNVSARRVSRYTGTDVSQHALYNNLEQKALERPLNHIIAFRYLEVSEDGQGAWGAATVWSKLAPGFTLRSIPQVLGPSLS